MKIKRLSQIAAFHAIALLSISANANEENKYATEFKGAAGQSCDIVFHKIEAECQNMICRDVLVNTWAECWKKSMNTALNTRLLKLKSTDSTEFHFEMNLQKEFNTSVKNLCAKDCGSGGTMKGISYNFCRVSAYKYRTDQAMQINKNQLSIPLSESAPQEKSHKDAGKDGKLYKTFSEQLCKMPKSVWKGESQPSDCPQKSLKELSSFTFTDDACDLT